MSGDGAMLVLDAFAPPVALSAPQPEDAGGGVGLVVLGVGHLERPALVAEDADGVVAVAQGATPQPIGDVGVGQRPAVADGGGEFRDGGQPLLQRGRRHLEEPRQLLVVGAEQQAELARLLGEPGLVGRA